MAESTSSISAQPYVPLFNVLPPTPWLPPARYEGTASINNISLWYGLYGPFLTCGRPPVVFLHGGTISSKWWGHQIKHVIDKGHPAIAIDTRAHGRSSDDPNTPLSYDLFADDVVALLEHLDIPSASFVGWSDGANTAISLAMRYSAKVSRVFAFGANYRTDQANDSGSVALPFGEDLGSRVKTDYETLSPTPGEFETFVSKVRAMQSRFPAWDEGDFARIKTLYDDPLAPVMWFVSGDSEELVKRDVVWQMQDMVRGSGLLIVPDVSHFGPLQDPETFNVLLDRWLSRR